MGSQYEIYEYVRKSNKPLCRDELIKVFSVRRTPLIRMLSNLHRWGFLCYKEKQEFRGRRTISVRYYYATRKKE
tara:strand:+ start:283 stop:504 length:222 start_codon:yes stop_codon:yes gene_type:complete